MSISTIKHYNEMSTPLPFILYSVWGRIFNFDIQTLRIFSVIIAFITYFLFHKLVFSIFNDAKTALLTTAYIVIFPYMVGLSIFVFTDMLAILFIILSCISIRSQNAIILTISLACGLLCRQYLVFFVLAAGIYYLAKYCKDRKQDASISPLTMLFSCLISLLPLAILAVLWNGLSPDNDLKKIYLDEGYGFHPSYFTVYACLLSIYLAPFILLSWKIFYKNRTTIIISFIVSLFYWLFPVRACKYQINANIHTIGFFHKFVKIVFVNQSIQDVIFYTAFLLSLPIIIVVGKDIYFKWRDNHLQFPFLLDLAIITFLITMPFSYLCWEKYFLPLLPLATIRILLFKYPDDGGRIQGLTI